jgi:hypothetical protein
MSGSGDLKADAFKVGKATVTMRGPGSAGLSTVSDSLDAELHGSGGLNAAMAGHRLTLRMSGPGDATISGTVDTVSAQLSGPGDLKGRNLVAGQADIHVSGPGSAKVHVMHPAAQQQASGQRAALLLVEREGQRQVQD